MSEKHPDGRFVDDAPYDPQASIRELERKDLDAPNWVLIWRKFKTHRLGLISGIFLLFCYVMLPFVGFIAPYGPNERNAEHLYSPPQSVNFFHEGEFLGPFIYPLTSEADLETFQWVVKPDYDNPQQIRFFCEGAEYRLAGLIPANTHLFCAPEGATLFLWGSDRLGRDIFSRVLVGAQISLAAGVFAVFIGAAIGTLLGLLAGYYEGWWDRLIMRICDVLFAFPGILLAIAVVAVLGSGIANVIIAVAIFSIPAFARLVRGNTLVLKQQTFIESARSIGASDMTVLLRHILPGTVSSIVVFFTMRIGTSIISAASLSFLGLGAQPPTPEWGAMLNEARADMVIAPHVAVFPALAIFLTVLAFNLLGDGLRDALDPKIKG